MTNVTKIMSEYKFIKDYAKWREEDNRYETWEEAVDRVMDMHKYKYAKEIEESDELKELIEFATEAYKDKFTLGSQRALQFGGEPILRNNAKLYNCVTLYADRTEFFNQTLWLLLCGCGVGFSVQKHHIEKLPKMASRNKGVKTLVIEDSIEGWADAVGVLISSFCEDNAVFKEYQGYRVDFDYSKIRPEGSLIRGGFKAPGPEGLRQSLIKIDQLLSKVVADNQIRKLKPIEVYDIVMHMSDAVLSGGIRRSASISVFSPDDEEMLKAKAGNWFVENPQRGRSNNSALLVRGKTKKEEFLKLFESVKQYGEPGIVWAESTEVLYNPCVVH